MKKGILIAVILIVAVGAGLLTARFFLGEDEDTWLCQNGGWVKHGNPSSSAPAEGCGINTTEDIGNVKDNPSGLPQNDDQLRVPVKFVTSTETIQVRAYFNNTNLDPEVSCNKVFPVSRTVVKTSAVARTALEELLEGPTEKEKEDGFFTSINPGVKIEKLTIEDGVVKVEFNEQLEFQVGGSCKVSAIRTQIVETLKQFDTIKDVIISINGRTEDILQP